MVRKLALAVSLALGTLSVPVHALGLGELSSKSNLNQNFQGEIALLSVKPEELDTVRVKLADQAAFARAGVDRPFYLSLLKFEPLITQRGKPVIGVTSEFPIREPFLNFLVEVNWPNGRLLREYTVLLDPPTTTRRRPPVVKPAATQARSEPAPTRSTPARSVVPTPSVPTTSVTSGAAASAAADEYGPVKANDTAWSIAKKLRPSGVSMEQMMMALLEANPQAFIDNDINRLRRGRILRVPAVPEIQQLSRAEARAAYRKQQDAWLARRDAKLQSTAQAEGQDQPAAIESDAAEAAAKLKIATARPEGAGEAGAGDDDAVSATPSDLSSRLIAARENAETSRQEAETLRSRVDDLQARLQNMQKLLSLKDEQLAQLQDNVVNAEADAEATEKTETAQSGESVPVDPDAIVEQAAAQVDVQADAVVMESIEETAPADVVIEETTAELAVAESPVDAPAEAVASSAEDVATAIDDAVADLVGEVAPPPADYQIEDIAPQIDPDRIVESWGSGETPAAPASAGDDLQVPVQIDPDRIVLDLDQAAAPVETEISIDVPPADDVAAPSGTEMVIEGDTATELMPAAPGPQAEPAMDQAQTPGPGTAEPAPAEPAVAESAAEQAEPIIPASMVSMVEKNIVPIAAGGVGLLALLGWLFARGRRRQDKGEEVLAGVPAAAAAENVAESVAATETAAAADEPILDPESLADLPDSAFLDDFSPSDINALQDETGEVDPVSEADVYIAYGRYQQAQELLRQAMERDPDRLALKHKLLEVHYATRNADAYVALATEMVNAGQDTVDAEAWARAQDMGRELAPENSLFAQREERASWAAGAAGVAAAAGATAGVAAAVGTEPATVDADSTVEDFEISELTAAYQEETSALNDLEKTSEVSISLDLEDPSELAAQPEAVAAAATESLENVEPLEFEMPEAEPATAETAVEDAAGTDTLDLDSMMKEAEAAVDQDNSELSLDSDFGAAELQAQLDELSDLSALDSTLDETPEIVPVEPSPNLGLVAEDTGSVERGLDEPLSLDLAYDADQNDDALDTLELDTSEPSAEEEVSTKLDLARAYVEMGDNDGARSILEEVVTEGDDGQRGEATQILDKLG